MQDGVLTYPSIAQLAERETVEAKQLSLGHWFESGWTETFFLFLWFPISISIFSSCHISNNFMIANINKYVYLWCFDSCINTFFTFNVASQVIPTYVK